MVKHIILWDFKPEFTQEQNKENARIIKEGLENLINLIDGIEEIYVETNPLDSSTCQICLYSVFKDQQSFDIYKTHPEHVKVATFVRSVTVNRKCIDYTV